jgi:hypothetical protein
MTSSSCEVEGCQGEPSPLSGICKDHESTPSRAERDWVIRRVAFVVGIEAPCPERYRRAVADYIRGRVGNL